MAAIAYAASYAVRLDERIKDITKLQDQNEKMSAELGTLQRNLPLPLGAGEQLIDLPAGQRTTRVQTESRIPYSPGMIVLVQQPSDRGVTIRADAGPGSQPNTTAIRIEISRQPASPVAQSYTVRWLAGSPR